jgi:pyruvate formate-lyase activating enzyme-like uncharacterized protein
VILPIDKDVLATIGNERLARAARRYVDMYEAFLADISAAGMALASPRPRLGEERLQALRRSGAQVLGRAERVHAHALSEACRRCRTGVGSRTFILTLACNRDCYFCSNRNQEHYEAGRNTVYDVVAEFDAAAERLGTMRAVALTGGEPLLHPDACERFVRHVKGRSPGTHVRIYSNGDLATRPVMRQLGRAGLDEIRFGLKLREDSSLEPGSLDALANAEGEIPAVVVEMPVPPGSGPSMRDLLAELDRRAIYGINLLEYLFPWKNAHDYRRRGFAVKARPYEVLYDYEYAGGLPIDGSEEECVALVEWAMAQRLRIGVHYCSLENKLTAQRYHQNAGIALTDVEAFSQGDFFIKTARVYGQDAAAVTRALERAGVPHVEDPCAEAVEFHPAALTRLAHYQHTRDLEVGITFNMVESNAEGKVLREVGIGLTTPRTFEASDDL